MSEQTIENTIERHLATHKPYLIEAARRAQRYARQHGCDYDGQRDEMILRVETYLFNDLTWESIPATVISDIAHEIADEVIRDR